MRAFVRAVALFLLPVVALVCGLEYLQRILPNEYVFRRQLLERRAPQLETLILGSSHTYMGINPAYLSSNALNMAYTAQTLYFDDFLLEKYLPQMPGLKTVILPISYPTYGAESNLLPGDYNRSSHFHLFYGASKFVNYTKAQHYSWLALFTFRGSVKRTLDYYYRGLPLVEADTNGWFGTHDRRDLEKNGKDSGTFHDAYYSEQVVPDNLARVARIIRRCQERNIRLLLLSMPMYPTYFNHTTPARYELMVSKTDSLARKYGVDYLNFSQSELFEAADFFDSNHLSPNGSARFTRMLDSLIQGPHPPGGE